MKYKKCPRCGLNYIAVDSELCKVCMDELAHKKSDFDTDDDSGEYICPFCYKNRIGYDDIMCVDCRQKRGGDGES